MTAAKSFRIRPSSDVERKYNIDFDRGLSAEQRSIAWAFEKMMEDHIYWLVVHARWMDDLNFARGPATFFRGVTAPIRPLVVAMIRRPPRRNMPRAGIDT